MNIKNTIHNATVLLALSLSASACDAPESSHDDFDDTAVPEVEEEDADGSADEGANDDGTDGGIDDDDSSDDGTSDDGGGSDDDEPADADPACGDGVVNPERGEECDDGNVDELDGCRLDCSFGPTELRVNQELATPLDVRGGPDGIGFDAECPTNEVIVGLRGRSGDVVNQLQVQCGAIGLTSPELGQLDISVEPGTAMETYGGDGGGSFWLQCPEDHVVVGFGDRSNDLVEMISLRCAPLNLVSDPEMGGLSIEFGPAFTTGAAGDHGVEDLIQHCPAGEAATSTQGRSDADINAFGMTCRPLELF